MTIVGSARGNGACAISRCDREVPTCKPSAKSVALLTIQSFDIYHTMKLGVRHKQRSAEKK